MDKNDLHVNHWNSLYFREVVSTKHLWAILDRHGSWVFRNGRRANIKSKRIGPGRYEVLLEAEGSDAKG